jgi:hypothetical protein
MFSGRLVKAIPYFLYKNGVHEAKKQTPIQLSWGLLKLKGALVFNNVEE